MKVLFDVHYLYFWPHFSPIWEVLRTRQPDINGFATYYSKEHPNAKPFTEAVLREAGLQLLTGQDEQTRLASLESRKYDLAFVGGLKPGYDVIRRQSRVVCSLAHGLGRKQAYFTDAPPDSDIRFTEGPRHYTALRERFPDLRVELTGMSKLDPLFSNDESTQARTSHKYNIDTERPVILWAPTFYPSSLEVLWRTVAKIAARKDYQWIIKPHHFTHFPRQGRYKRQKKLLGKLAGKSDNITIVPPEEYSILSWLQVADLLLSDTSSTLFEMVALDKPVIKCEKYKKRWNHRLFPSRLYKKRLDTETTGQYRFAVAIDSGRQLQEAIDTAIQDPDWLRTGRQETREHLFYRLDGHASQRIVTHALTLLENNG